MMSPLQSLVACGTKVWLDSIDPDEVARNLAFGATGATSNPIIISDLIKTGRLRNPAPLGLKLDRAEYSRPSVAWRPPLGIH